MIMETHIPEQFSIVNHPTLPTGRFEMGVSQLQDLVVDTVEQATHETVPPHLHIGVGKFSNYDLVVPLMTTLAKARRSPLKVTLYGVPDIDLGSFDNLSFRSLSPSAELSNELFLLSYSDAWRFMLAGAMQGEQRPTATGLISERLPTIETVANYIQVQPHHVPSVMPSTALTANILQSLARSGMNVPSNIDGVHDLALPLAFTWLLENFAHSRWEMAINAIQRITQSSRVAIYQLDATYQCLRTAIATDGSVIATELAWGNPLSDACLTSQPTSGFADGAWVSGFPVFVDERVWGVLAVETAGPLSVTNVDYMKLITEILAQSLKHHSLDAIPVDTAVDEQYSNEHVADALNVREDLPSRIAPEVETSSEEINEDENVFREDDDLYNFDLEAFNRDHVEFIVDVDKTDDVALPVVEEQPEHEVEATNTVHPVPDITGQLEIAEEVRQLEANPPSFFLDGLRLFMTRLKQRLHRLSQMQSPRSGYVRQTLNRQIQQEIDSLLDVLRSLMAVSQAIDEPLVSIDAAKMLCDIAEQRQGEFQKRRIQFRSDGVQPCEVVEVATSLVNTSLTHLITASLSLTQAGGEIAVQSQPGMLHLFITPTTVQGSQLAAKLQLFKDGEPQVSSLALAQTLATYYGGELKAGFSPQNNEIHLTLSFEAF